jgi:CheY-like chemotaxis protein
VRRTPGQGSVFFAILPRAGGPSSRPSPVALAPGASATSGAPTVLVIEDSAKDRDWLERVLTQAGYAVETAASGTAAVELARRRAFDAITLDLILPDMSASDVMAAIRREGFNQTIPVVVVSVVAERQAAAGFVVHDFLTKPVEPDTLLASLARAGVSPAAGRPVLILDDDQPTLRLAATALAERGYRVLSGTSGAAGLWIAETHSPAAIILDLVMPGMDGLEFLDLLRASERRRRVPVIVWTARDLTAGDWARLEGTVARVVLKRNAGIAPLLAALDDVMQPA